MAITIIKDLAKAAHKAFANETISDLANGPGRYYRHPDSVHVSYPIAAEQPIGQINIPEAGMRVGIIGAGAAGITALYELSRIANNSTSGGTLQVTLFEADPNNILFDRSGPLHNAGRVSSFTTAADETVYEIGAMRFPEIAGLTWHYAQEVYAPDAEVAPFPNPGAIPTEFHFGAQSDRYHGGEWYNSDSPTRQIRDIVIDGLVGVSQPSLYPIGSRDPSQLIEVLKAPVVLEETLEEINSDWQQFIQDHDGTTLGAAVRQIIEQAGESRLPDIDGLSGQELINWCVELFGRFGFGTGGFKPLYNISLVEMMRLLLWDYSAEYTFPAELAPSNIDMLEALYNKAATTANFDKSTVEARVTNVTRTVNTTSAFSTIHYVEPTAPTTLQSQDFDYVIIALPHDAAAPLVSRTGFRRTSQAVPVGDARASGSIQAADGFIVPPLSLQGSPTEDVESIANSRVAAAMASLNMTRSTKVFATISEADATGSDVPVFSSGPISAVVSDSGLAATYMVPSTISPGNFRSLLVSYTWDNDSTKLQNTLGNWPLEISTPGADEMYNAMLTRSMRTDAFAQGTQTWWLNDLLKHALPGDRTSYDWTTHTSAGGFKLDNTGDHHQTSLCFRYHTIATKAATDRYVGGTFLAGDSFSHLGGWLEGAFMTAINAVAGIVVSANNGDLASLNSEARKLFDHIAPVATR